MDKTEFNKKYVTCFYLTTKDGNIIPGMELVLVYSDNTLSIGDTSIKIPADYTPFAYANKIAAHNNMIAWINMDSAIDYIMSAGNV